MGSKQEELEAIVHAARKLRPSCHYGNLVGQISGLECSYQWLQAVQKGQMSLQTDESEPACANLMDSDSTVILQQTIVNEVQNTYTNISEDETSCTEQTLQANAETLLAHELLAAANGESVSESHNSTSGILSTIEPEKGGRILLNAEGVEGCHIETENTSSLEIEPVAVQFHEKDTLQIRSKRDNLQETNSKGDLRFGVNADSNSPYSFQIVENVQKEASQKTGAIFCLKIITL
ncbi:ankyrin repeat domain-containing protein 31 [Grus japonensis]|uniref:Ankyrin repeat domain-containing protein 31 n=1 Tax=Grus japonensis TaxID=30415 RepID=A0ABC9Y212_GRUJA